MHDSAIGPFARLWIRWLWTRWPAASAEHSDSSPAITVAQMIRASCCAFAPGVSAFAPCTPRIFRHADCAGNDVPPPTVPTSMQGIVTDMYKSFPSFMLMSARNRAILPLHEGDAIRALDILRWILAGREVNRCQNVRCVGIESANRS